MEPYKKIANLLWETSSSNHASTAKLDIMPKNVNKLLVANRGEIALRVVRTAREMGIPTVAVYAEQDRHAQYVQMADDAYLLSGDTYKDTYLNEDLLIDILQRSGADAVHPGYGFLSEVASFAQKVLDAGATWVGPNPKALVDLGDKITARRVATFAKVPPVPGISQSISDMRLLLDFAHTHGYPLMLKRTDGGGGRGITLVHNDDELRGFYMNHDALQGGDLDEYFVERFIDKGRHVETQCGRDSHGNFTVYSTRDCSVQRRNQKLVEEAPAPFLSDGVLEQLETYSRRLFEAVDYIGLGTCEFMVTEQGKVYFLEVNPRLQVEHTVSEEVCGLDLVREQLTIANGGELTVDHPLRGHSFELRLTCEDPAKNLAPSSGTLTKLAWPSGPGIRVDSGVVEGVPTPASLFEQIFNDDEFTAEHGVAYDVSTKWLERKYLNKEASSTKGGQPASMAGASGAKEAEQKESSETFVIEVNNHRVSLTVPNDIVANLTGGAKARDAKRAIQPLRGQGLHHVEKKQQGNDGQSGVIASPMQAVVTRINVAEGQDVAKGDLLVVLESMKMENYVYAPVKGTVTKIFVGPAAGIEAGETLMTIDVNGASKAADGKPATDGNTETKTEGGAK